MQHKKMDPYAAKTVKFRARQLLGKACFSASDREDLEQELSFDLLRRSHRYDPERAGRRTFTDRVVQRHAATILDERFAPTRDVRRESFSLNELVIDDEGMGVVERIATLDAQVNRDGRSLEDLHHLRMDIETVSATLPPRLRALAECLKTESVTDAARARGLSRRQTYRLIEKIRRRFTEAGLRDYLR